MIRFLLATLAALAPSFVLAQALPSPFYKRVIITGPSSTGDASAMSVKPTGSMISTPIADLIAQRLTTRGNDLTGGVYAGVGPLIPFGNTDTQTYVHSRRVGLQPSILGTAATIRAGAGSGTDGPAAADYAHMFSNTKDNWNTATGSAAVPGETDNIIALTRGGKRGDVSAILVDVLKRRDALTTTAADESGAPIAIEGNVGLVDGAGIAFHRMHFAQGFAESPGSTSGGRGYGSWNETRAGTWFSAYHASSLPGVDETGVALPNGWTYYFSGSLNRDPSSVNYAVDNTGRVCSGFSTARVCFGYRSGADNFTLEDQANAVALAVGRTNKVTTAVGGLQIGGGTTTVYRNAASVTATIPTLANFAVGNLAAVPLAGARPGDMVSAEIISAEIGFAGYRVSGVVAANDNVQLRVQNLNGATAGNVSVAVTVKAERFQ